MAAKRKKKAPKVEEISMQKVGHFVFLVGVLIALLAGIFLPGNEVLIWILALLGLVVGLINITIKDEVPFLVAVIALIVASQSFVYGLQWIPAIGENISQILSGILGYVIMFVAPAAVVVALKAVYVFAKEE